MTVMTDTGPDHFNTHVDRRGDYDKNDVANAAGWIEGRSRAGAEWRVMNGAVIANAAAERLRRELGLPAESCAVETARRRLLWGSCKRCGGALDMRMRRIKGVWRETRFCPAMCGKPKNGTRKD